MGEDFEFCGWHSSSCSLKDLLYWSLAWYVSIQICLVPFWAAVFSLFHVSFHSCSILSPHSCIPFFWNFNLTHTFSVVVHTSDTMHVLPSALPFSRQLGSTFPPQAILFHYIHLALILILFPYLLSLGKASRRLRVSLAFTLIWVLF